MQARSTVLALAATLLATMSAAAQTGAGQETPAGEASKPRLAYVVLYTSMGDILLELNREQAPISVQNFIDYVDKRFYHDTIFHRVISNFMIQGGGFTVDYQRKTDTADPIKNEWQNGLKNVRGTIAMARTADPDSATSQFFINVRDNTNLDRPISGGAGYAVFGKVVGGMDVVDAIRNVPVKASRLNPREKAEPVEAVVIREARQITAEQAMKRLEAERSRKAAEKSGEDDEGGDGGDGGGG